MIAYLKIAFADVWGWVMKLLKDDVFRMVAGISSIAVILFIIQMRVFIARGVPEQMAFDFVAPLVVFEMLVAFLLVMLSLAFVDWHKSILKRAKK